VKCERCGGRVFIATDESRGDDSHCVVCGHRVFVRWTAEQIEAIQSKLISERRTEGSRRSMSRKGSPA